MRKSTAVLCIFLTLHFTVGMTEGTLKHLLEITVILLVWVSLLRVNVELTCIKAVNRRYCFDANIVMALFIVVEMQRSFPLKHVGYSSPLKLTLDIVNQFIDTNGTDLFVYYHFWLKSATMG